MRSSITAPAAVEYPDFFRGYISLVEQESDLIGTLERQRGTIEAWMRIPPARGSYRYGEGKWTVKEVISHIIDAERIFTYRLLRISRGDKTPLVAFDENAYVAASHADARELSDMVTEMKTVRESSLTLVRSLHDGVLSNVGEVRAGAITARAQAYVIAGHFAHHARILQERYGVSA